MMDNCSGMWRAADRGLARCIRELGLSPLGLLGSPSRVNIYNPKIICRYSLMVKPLPSKQMMTVRFCLLAPKSSSEYKAISSMLHVQTEFNAIRTIANLV